MTSIQMLSSIHPFFLPSIHLSISSRYHPLQWLSRSLNFYSIFLVNAVSLGSFKDINKNLSPSTLSQPLVFLIHTVNDNFSHHREKRQKKKDLISCFVSFFPAMNLFLSWGFWWDLEGHYCQFTHQSFLWTVCLFASLLAFRYIRDFMGIT